MLGKYSPVGQTKDDLTYVATYTVTNKPEYEGYALPGTATSDIGWQIRKNAYDGSDNLASVTFANSDNGFLFEWDERASYTYA